MCTCEDQLVAVTVSMAACGFRSSRVFSTNFIELLRNRSWPIRMKINLTQFGSVKRIKWELNLMLICVTSRADLCHWILFYFIFYESETRTKEEKSLTCAPYAVTRAIMSDQIKRQIRAISIFKFQGECVFSRTSTTLKCVTN